MKQYFENRVFNDELDLWNYLQTLKSLNSEVDGYYFGEYFENPGAFEFRCILKFSDKKTLDDVLYVRPYSNPRFYIYIKNGQVFCVGLDAAYFVAHEEINQLGEWQLYFYRDKMSELEEEKKQFTSEELSECCNALFEMLIVKSKKVA